MISKKVFLRIAFIIIATKLYSQKVKKNFLFSPTKFGLQIVQGNENNFMFDDEDYFYKSNTIKGQFYYSIASLRTIDISFIIQPQIQLIQHQLYNKYFVNPEENNYLVKRQKFTQLKNLSISAVEFSIETKKHLFKGFNVFLEIGLGFAYIDTETERLAKGFTFIENGNIGIEISTSSKTSFQLFVGVGHVSNFNFKMPNSGYNIMNTGISIQYLLQ